MNDPADKRGRRAATLLLLLILAAGLAMRLPVIAAPLERAVGLCLADDAFYYFQIARNIINGQGSSFDGVVATNGYHPLYMLLLLPLFKLWPAGGEPPVRAAMLLLALAWLAAAWPVYLIGRRLGGRPAGLFAALFFCLSPFSPVISGMGVEAPLAVLLLAWAAWFHLAIARGRPEQRYRRSAGLGALLGLAVLARTDSGLFCVALGLDLLWSMRRDPRRAAQHGLACAATAGLLFAPWLIWSRLALGHFSQDSGSALFVLTRHEFAGSGLGLAQWVKLKLLEGFDAHLLRYLGLSRSWPALAALLGLIAAAAAGTRARRKQGLSAATGAFIWCGAGLTWLFYAAIFWSQRHWYHGQTVLALALLLGLAAAAVMQAAGRRRGLAAALALALLALGWQPTLARLWRDGVQPWQSRYYRAAHELARDAIPGVGPDEPLAAFNSGIYGYFAEREVVNLDGVVNRQARDALAQGRLDRYLRERGIDLIIDHAALILSFGDRCQRPWGTVHVLRKYGDIYLVRLPGEGGT